MINRQFIKEMGLTLGIAPKVKPTFYMTAQSCKICFSCCAVDSCVVLL